MNASDPRLELVENILEWHAGKPVRERAGLVLAALDDLHAHDNRTCITFDDETEPDELETQP